MADGEGTRQQRNAPEITYRDLWDIVNELKNQNEQSIRRLAEVITTLGEKVAVMTDRSMTYAEALQNLRDEVRTAKADAAEAKRVAGEMQIDIRNLQARMLTDDQQRDVLETSAAFRKGQAESSTARLTRQNTLLAFALTFTGMGFLAPRLGDIIRALTGH